MSVFVDLIGKKIFFCGIGGIGMSAIAGFLFDSGISDLQILGSGDYENENIIRLRNIGVKINIGHDRLNIPVDIDFFIHTDVISQNNVELLRAKELGVKIFTRGEFLAKISNGFEKNINISGTHGKTTTSGMVGQMLDFVGENPAIICGGLIKNYKSNYRVGSNFFVKEADESNDSFLALKTHSAIITSIEEDHLENHNDISKIYEKFVVFCKNSENIVICNEYKYCQKIIKLLHKEKNIISYGMQKTADIHAENVVYEKNFIKFDVYYLGKRFLKSVKIYMFGKHNILNSLATIGAGIIYNIDKKLLKKSLANFKGISNRFDILGQKNNNLIISDYAHNPCKIRCAINSAIHLQKHNNKYRKYHIIVFFEPHKHSRVRFLMEDFARSFKAIDKLYVLDIYKSYEMNQEIMCKEFFANKIKERSKVDIALVDTEKVKIIKEISHISNSIILFLSAGNYNLAHEICKGS